MAKAQGALARAAALVLAVMMVPAVALAQKTVKIRVQSVIPTTADEVTMLKEFGADVAALTNNTVTFEVRPDANKVEIRSAVEAVFNVKVAAVRTASFQGKLKRMGRHQGRRADWKKAIVTLAPGHKIELVEGA